MSKQPKFLTGSAQERRDRQSRAHEKHVAKAFGGVVTVGSGNKGMKGDVWASWAERRGMVECKSTEGPGISVTVKWITKLLTEALAAGRVPLLHLEFSRMKWAGKRRWVCLPEDEFLALVERAGEA